MRWYANPVDCQRNAKQKILPFKNVFPSLGGMPFGRVRETISVDWTSEITPRSTHEMNTFGIAQEQMSQIAMFWQSDEVV